MKANAPFYAVIITNDIVSTGLTHSSSSSSRSGKSLFFTTWAQNIKLSQIFPHRRDADLKGTQVKWRVLHLRVSSMWLSVLLSAAASWDKVKNSCHDPSSSREIWFDGDMRCCPTFCSALLGTVLTLPFSPSWKQRARRGETTALNTAL